MTKVSPIRMNHTRTTKNFEMFVAADESAPITNVYVRKDTFTDGVPNTITITIAEVK